MAGKKRLEHSVLGQVPVESLFGSYWQWYESWLAAIARWQTGLPCRTPGFSENVLQHTQGMIKLSRELMCLYPHLARRLNPQLVENMIWLHDGGEGCGGDLARSNPEYDASCVSRDERERQCFDANVVPKLRADAQVPSRMAFREFQTATQDPSIAFAILVDIMHGSRVASKHFYNLHTSNGELAQHRRTFEKYTLNMLLQKTEGLSDALAANARLPILQAQNDVRQLLTDELVYHQHHGSVVVVAEFFRQHIR